MVVVPGNPHRKLECGASSMESGVQPSSKDGCEGRALWPLQAREGAEPWRPELPTDTLRDFQDLNFGPHRKNNFTSTSVMEAKHV